MAQLYQGAADEAKKWASAGMTTPKMWNEGVAPSIISEGHERIKTYERAIEKQKPSFSPTVVREFANESDASKAGLTPGTRVKIGGKMGTWQ